MYVYVSMYVCKWECLALNVFVWRSFEEAIKKDGVIKFPLLKLYSNTCI